MSRGRLIISVVIVAVLLATGGFLIGRLGGSAVADPTTESPAAGFLRDMQVHHAQAVSMAMTIRDTSDDPALRLLAYDIALGQSGQSGQMFGLLEAWGLPQASPGPRMSWMSAPVIDGTSGGGHEDMGGADEMMPGMATDDQLAALDAATGVEAEKLFLTLMIAHHRGGLEMAEAILSRTTVPQVLSIANGVIASQTADIDAMQAMLDARS